MGVRPYRRILVPVLAAALAGCQPCRNCGQRREGLIGQARTRYQIVPVTGVVTYKGKPLAGGTIAFFPDKSLGGYGPSAFGEIDSEGRFRLTTDRTGDGAVVGPHVVQIRSAAAWRNGNEELPARYNERSTLRTVVQPDPPNTLDFRLY